MEWEIDLSNIINLILNKKGVPLKMGFFSQVVLLTANRKLQRSVETEIVLGQIAIIHETLNFAHKENDNHLCCS
jgi:hypothetical protein